MTIYLYDDIKKHLALDREQIINLSILLGCDFNERVKGVGKVTAMKKILSEKFNIDNYEKEHGEDKVRAKCCTEYFTISDNDKSLVEKFFAK